MTYKNYSYEQHVELTKQGYRNYKQTFPVKIGKSKTVIGYVSQVNNKPSGEQSFVITDHYE